MLSLIASAAFIFLMRIADVSLGTLRIVMLVRGRRTIAGVLAFFESIVWLIAAGQVLTNLDSPVQFIAYAAGYAAGTMSGSTVERWLALGNAMVRIIAPIDSPSVADALRERGYYVTVLNAAGRDGEVRISFSVIPRKRIPETLRLIHEINAQAFVTFEETTMSTMKAPPAVRVRK